MDSMDVLIELAEQTKDKEMFVQIGNAFMTGNDVKKSITRAITFYEKAAALGSADAKTTLGRIYYYGQGVPKNCKVAKQYLKEAVDQGSVLALVYLGWMCYNNDYGWLSGRGKAFDFWQKAAKLGNAESQRNIAYSYLTEEWGAEKSYKKAAFWFMCSYQNTQ